MSVERTLCNRDCPDACGILATVEDGRVTALRGDPDHPVTRGFLCYRTGHFLERQYSPSRLTTPLLRKDGELRPVSWEEALDVAAERLLAIRRQDGPAAILHYRSGGTLGLLGAVTSLFFERFGPVTIKRGDICSGAGEHAQELDFGVSDSSDLLDLVNARHILLWGKNVVTSSPHTLPVLKDARSRGAEVVLIDPVHHKTVRHCDRFLQPRPGGDPSLALAVARILFERGWVAPEAATICDHLDGFRALAMERAVEAWCRDADAPVEAAVDLARRLWDRPAAILVGWGMGRRTNGAAIVRALDALGAISGNLGLSGGGVSFYFRRRGAFDASFVRGAAVAPRTLCEPLLGREILAAKDPPVRAVWVTAGNPVVMLPESHTTARALASRDFVVVADAFLTDTARHAHLVLPTPTLLEADDLLGSYGHHTIGVARPVVPPPAGVRSDLEIVQGLAARVGLGDVVAGTAREWKARMVAPKLTPHGVTLETLEAGPIRNPLAPRILFADGRFPTPTGRVNLMTALPSPTAEPTTPEWPMVLMSLSTEKAQSSQWVREPEGPAEVTVHPDSSAGVADGALCRLESRVSSLVVRLRHDLRQRRDVALLPKGGGYEAGRCPNALVLATITDGGEGGALYDERVRIIPGAA